MTLVFKHFDTRLNQWIHTDGDPKNTDSILTEELDNTLLESFFPDKEFSFGQMDEYSTLEDLTNHPDGHVLLLSSKTRLLYGPPECLEVIEKLCPDRKDRGAYGSIFLGDCKNTINQQLNILVVDDTTGENGGILPDDVAYKLVGDCYGQISTELYDRLTKREEQEDKSYRVIQHRFGWRSLDGEDIQYRFGKGTLRPHQLERLPCAKGTPKVDLIIPLSSFKGTDKDNPSGPIKPQIKAGIYNQTIWLGEKSQSQKGKTAISQLLASFPQGVKDFAEGLEKLAQELAEIQKDPRKVAQLYCEKYEKRKAFTEEQKASLKQEIANQLADGTLERQVELSTADSNLDEELYIDDDLNEDNAKSEKDDLLMYKIIKADQLGHFQLLETEKVKQELSRFVQKEWRDIAIGRTLTFNRGMIIPSKELKNGEICVPWFKEDEKILNFRSPFLNSNGLCVSINKHVEDYVGPDGKPLEGIIVVNDEDHKRIQARIDALKAQGIKTDQVDPAETESERQGRDFDGDCIGVELASKYPNFTAEAEYRNLTENAYAPTVKLKKQSFYRKDKTQPPFEEIAIHMSDGISVGIINNHVTALEALESEIKILKIYGTREQQSEYLDQVSSHYKKLLAQENNEKYPKPIRAEYREPMKEFVALSSVQNRTPEITQRVMEINRQMYRKMIEEACYQNQIAVDLFKSAKTPDMDLIKENKRYLHRDVNYIKDKKSRSAYLDEGIAPKGYSPVELLISQTNKYFQEAQLESRPIIQFQDLFKGVEFTPQQKFAAILAKQEFDTKFNEATRLERRRETEIGPYAIIQTPQGTQIEITNLTRYGHPGIWKAQTLNIRLEEIPEKSRSSDRPHKLLAVATIDGETNLESGQPVYRKLGTVSQQSAIDYKLKAGMTTVGATLIEIKPQLSKSQTKLLFQQAYEGAEAFRGSMPESERLSAAAAAWSISATRQDEIEKKFNNSSETVESEDRQQVDTQKKVSNFVFAAFPNEIISRLEDLQFTNIKLTGIGKEGDSFKGKVWNPFEKYSLLIRASHYPEGHERHASRLVFVKDSDGEYKEFAVPEQRTGRLPIGTKALANIVPGEAYTAKATLQEPGKPPVEFTIREISKFSYAGRAFNDEQVTLSIGNVPVPDQTVKIKLDGKTLGELDADSIKQLKEFNYLNNGNALNLKFTSIIEGKNEGAFLIGESPNGNLLRINKVSFYDFKGQIFDDKDYRNVTIEIPPTKTRDAVLLNGEPLGVLHFKQDKEALKQLGILKQGQLTSIPCTLQSNFSHTFVKVDPTTVQYPEVWTKESQAFKETTKQFVVTQQEVMIEKSEPILQKIKERPTILFSTQEDRMLGLIGMAVDNHKVDTVTKWLTDQNIEFNLVPPKEVPLETQKGLAVFTLASDSISPQTFAAMVEKFGIIFDSAQSQTAIPIFSEQAVYFYNPSQEYISEDGTQSVQIEAVGLVVPAQDAIEVSSWLSYIGIENQYFTENNCATFIIEKSQLPESIQQELSSRLGEPINVGEVEGYNLYEQKLTQLNEELSKADSKLSLSSPQISEYHQRINSLHNRLQIVSEPSVFSTAVQAVENAVPNTPNKQVAAQPQEKGVAISGKPIPMNYPLMMHGETNPLPVDTCIDAMRGYGRTHTTRAYEPYKQYGFKEGDIAIATGGGKQVAFRVGKQYQITQEMIADPAYQQQWAQMEKHSAKALPELFTGKQQVWGLHIEPLGDYADGKIVPLREPLPTKIQQATTTTQKAVENTTSQVTETKIAPPVNIGSRSADPLGAALTNPTVLAKQLGSIQGDYPVSFRDNPAVPTGKYGPEIYQQEKQKGVPFASAEQAYQHYKETVPLGETRVQLMAEIIQAKLEQHPKLFQVIQQRGGVKWLENCTHYVTSSRDNYWEGLGKDSPFIRALIDGYSKVLEKSQTAENTDPTITTHTASVSRVEKTTVSTSLTSSPKTSNPLAELKGINDAVAHHMKKDVAMAQEATQFIGFSAAPPDTLSSTRNYSLAWGEHANTGIYSANDTIMVSGSGPWRGVTQQQILETFKNHYVPLLDKAIAAGSSFVVGNAAGTDQLVQQYLQEHGYKLEAQGDGYIRASSQELVTSVDSSKVQDVAPTQTPVTPSPGPPPPTTVPTPLTTTQNPFVASFQNIPQTGVMADTVGSYEQATIDSLRNWYSAADKLGKSEEYKNRITEVATEFKSGQGLSEKALIAMNKDMEELRSINRLTQIAQRVSDVLGQPGEGGSIQVLGKTYDIFLNPSQKDLTISHKNGDVILEIQSSKLQTNQVSSEVIKTFEDINSKIDTALFQVKSEYIEM